jgi:hypothetical protein
MNLSQITTQPNGAIFSDDRRYRYALCRHWDRTARPVMFIGLNPSTANETTDDPTIRRVCTMARSWGAGGVVMTNLFPFVTPYPAELCISGALENHINIEHLTHIHVLCDMTVVAWGNFKEAHQHGKIVSKLFPGAFCLHINKNGSPKHPLYVKGNVTPFNYAVALRERNKQLAGG